jgi:RecA-family ATPase
MGPMMLNLTHSAAPFTAAENQLVLLEDDVRLAAPEDRLDALRQSATVLQQLVNEGYLNSQDVRKQIEKVADAYSLRGEPGSDEAIAFRDIVDSATTPNSQREPDDGPGRDEPTPHTKYPPSADGERDFETEAAAAQEQAASPNLTTMTPASWKGTDSPQQRWLAHSRIPSGDLTILAGNGGSGKTEIAAGLLVSVAADLGDWLGSVVESGPALFLSCEEPEENIRDRIERICKHRGIDPYTIENLHLHFPDLESTWLAAADRSGRVLKTPLFTETESWIKARRPALVAIDSIAAVFDGEAIARRQVRTFLAMLRKVAREYDTAVVLLDHPSVRGMADGTGTANSVDWRNSVRAMLHLSDPDKQDPDVRELEVKKNNRGRCGEKTKLRWTGLTFSTDAQSMVSPHRAAAERAVEELFLRLLDKRLAQGRPIRPSSGRGSAPSELAGDPEANGITAEAFRAAMERLYAAGKIVTAETGPPKKRIKHIERAPGT